MLKEILRWGLVSILIGGILAMIAFAAIEVKEGLEWKELDTQDTTHYCIKKYNYELNHIREDCHKIDDQEIEIQDVPIGIERKITYRIDGKEYDRKQVSWEVRD